METAINVDWVTITGKYKNTQRELDGWNSLNHVQFAAEILGALLLTASDMQKVQGNRFYPYAFKSLWSDAKVFSSGQVAQGWMVQVSGSATKHVADWNFFLEAVHFLGGVITRVDVALDIFNSGWAAEGIYREWLLAGGGSYRKNHSMIHSQNGDTAYIGKRQSDAYMRIYEKGLQQKMEVDWLRAEIEIKGKRARAFGKALVENPRMGIIEMKRVLVVKDSDFYHYLETIEAGEPLVCKEVPPPASATFQWLMTVVVSCITKMAKSDFEAFKKFADEVAYIEARYSFDE